MFDAHRNCRRHAHRDVLAAADAEHATLVREGSAVRPAAISQRSAVLGVVFLVLQRGHNDASVAAVARHGPGYDNGSVRFEKT